MPMPESLSLIQETQPGLVLVHCAGRLVAGVAHLLQDEVKPLIGQGKRVVLDLTDITQMDSMGLGTIVSLYVSARSSGGRLELINLGQKIRLLFSMTNLLSIFEPAGDGNFRIP
jgi:anti-sigma B factor antagonist